MADTAWAGWPVLGICGYSGAGKTTLIEALVPRLLRDGLAVAVIKHDAHGLNVDREGKDSDRFFRAGATVFAHDPGQGLLRRHTLGGTMLSWAADTLLREHDLVLVEGHKHTNLPAKLWLKRHASDHAPPESGAVLASLGRDDDRVTSAHKLLCAWLREQARLQPVYAGLLIGGRSSRMGRPKQLIEMDGHTWAERVTEAILPHVEALCLLGSGGVPQSLESCPHLPDVPGVAGPASGMLAAFRWHPRASWLFAACDMPRITSGAVAWLLDQRSAGRWAILPRKSSGQLEPLFAWYDPRTGPLLQATHRPIALGAHPKTLCADIPSQLEPAWSNLNTPPEAAEWRHRVTVAGYGGRRCRALPTSPAGSPGSPAF